MLVRIFARRSRLILKWAQPTSASECHSSLNTALKRRWGHSITRRVFTTVGVDQRIEAELEGEVFRARLETFQARYDLGDLNVGLALAANLKDFRTEMLLPD